MIHPSARMKVTCSCHSPITKQVRVDSTPQPPVNEATDQTVNLHIPSPPVNADNQGNHHMERANPPILSFRIKRGYKGYLSPFSLPLIPLPPFSVSPSPLPAPFLSLLFPFSVLPTPCYPRQYRGKKMWHSLGFKMCAQPLLVQIQKGYCHLASEMAKNNWCNLDLWVQHNTTFKIIRFLSVPKNSNYDFHCRKQVALFALTCRYSPFALWNLADFG